MFKKYVIVSGALATSLMFAGCRPQSTTDNSLMSSPEVSTLPDTTGSGIDASTEFSYASASPAADVQGGVMVGGAMMLPSRPIPVNAADASNLTTLVAALKQADLVDTLSGPGPYTVFAPTNAAFEKLPAGTVQTWMKTENKAQLTKTLNYHVVQGSYDASKLTNGLKLKTVQGGTLTVMVKDGKISLKDAQGNISNVETADVMQSNGVVHVVDSVLIP